MQWNKVWGASFSLLRLDGIFKPFSTLLMTILTSMLVLSLTGCNDKLTYTPFDDTVFKYDSTDRYAIALGRKGLYVLRGEYRLYGKTGNPGVLLGYTGIYEYPIKDLLQRYPHCSDPEVEKIAEKQAKRLRRDEHQISSINESEVANFSTEDQNQSRNSRRKWHSVQRRLQPSSKASRGNKGSN